METRKGKNNGSSERGRNEADADNLGNDLDDVDSSRLSSIARAYIQLMQVCISVCFSQPYGLTQHWL